MSGGLPRRKSGRCFDEHDRRCYPEIGCQAFHFESALCIPWRFGSVASGHGFVSRGNSRNKRFCGGREIKVVSAPYFVALKLEAFEERGQKDFLGSTDFEDVICLFNGRESIVDEIASCDALRAGLAAKFSEYLESPELDDAVEGFVQTESNPENRKRCIVERFWKVAALSASGSSRSRWCCRREVVSD